jgi:hypothetical protein
MTLLLATRLLQALAAVLAVVLARRQREHRQLAALLVYGAVTNTVRIALQQLVVMPAVRALGGDPAQGIAPLAPLTGWARVAAHVDHALLLGWSAALAACAVAVFAVPIEQMSVVIYTGTQVERTHRYDSPRWEVAITIATAWFVMVAALVLTYPESRVLHRQAYLMADLLAIGVGLAAFVTWLRQRDRAEGMPVTKICMLLIICLDAVAPLGPHLAPGFYSGWDRALGAYVVLYGLLVLIQGGTLWFSK